FRGAEPEIFSTYRRKWPAVPTADGDGDDICEPRDAGVFMSDNFRCSRPVVRFVNRVSDYMFRDGEVPFCEEDMLHAATASEVEDPVEVKILFSGKTKVKSPSEEDYVADRIKEMLGTAPFGEKPLKPSDFAIILRKAKDKVEGFVNALKARGIPVSDSAGVSLSDRPEVEFALDLLRAVDNPHRDVPLANVMMSSLFSFSLDEMTTVRLKYRDGSLFSSVLLMSEDGEGGLSAKCAAFCARMRYFREMERSLGAAVFIERLFEETGIVRSPEVRGVIDGDKHLRAVLDMARDYEKNSWGGLYGFLCRVEDKKLGGGLKSALGGSEGVSVITVHGSKGLEWPVCFFCGTGRAVDSTTGYDIVHGKELGWAMRLPDPGGLIKYVTPLMKAIDARDHVGERYEEMRLIYVAMTRAVNKLIVVARSTRSENTLMQSADRAARFRDRHTMMTLPAEIDYILASLEGWRDGCYTLDTVVLPDEEEDEPAEEETAAAAEDGPSADPEKVAALVDSAEKRFAAQYPYSFLSGIPSKLSVSRLYPDVLSPEDGVADLEKEEEEEEKRDGPMPVPSFMTGSLPVTGRERGVATHGFLQFADFARLGTCRTEDEIARLTENGFISERDAGLVSVSDVEKFKKSPLFRRIAGARRVWREFRFNVLLPAEKFTSDPERAAKFAAEGVKITVQGVFDCVFEDADGKLVVADYKTDYMSREDRADPGAWVAKLRERHALQLRYYREAATLLFGREPDEVLIYALALGDTVDMKDA
ncbi:MAG: PD-(D/E)XK nuclease family protein, partial [Clostridia bacterium]|nr:PD-(D/E)XK nuclease family protein [Clostridia bacterium]